MSIKIKRKVKKEIFIITFKMETYDIKLKKVLTYVNFGVIINSYS